LRERAGRAQGQRLARGHRYLPGAHRQGPGQQATDPLPDRRDLDPDPCARSAVRLMRVVAGLAAGVAVIAVLLGLPAPKRPGPAAVASVWPKAQPFPIPATFPDGLAYTPTYVLDSITSVGMMASADGQQTDLSLVPASGTPRVLQSQSVTEGGSFDGITATDSHVYWMHTVSDAAGHAKVSLWAAPRAGDGPSVQLTADVGAPVFYGSQYDVQ